MNSDKKYQQLGNSFEQESSEGFKLFSDSEAYFSSIKNPFLKPAANYPTINKTIIGIELIVLIIMLTGLSYLTSEKPPVVVHAKKLHNREHVKREAGQNNPMAVTEVIVSKKPAIKNTASSYSSIPEVDTVQDFVLQRDTSLALLSNTLMQKDTLIEASEPQLRYTYRDYSRKYPLRYVADMLAINYTDTIITQPKLHPVLTGTPAIYEDERYKPLNRQKEVFQPIITTNDYLAKLERPMLSFSKSQYARAIKEFNQILKVNSEDQNALFYGMLAHYHEGNYTQALAYAFKTKGIAEAFFEQDVDWYTALCYKKLGQQQKANDLMQKIIHSNSFYKERAKALLAE
jgi:tetratricopeptide (TPR) repeat protein